MENKLEMFIRVVERRAAEDELEAKLLAILLRKQAELGSAPSDEEAEDAVNQAFREHLEKNLRPMLMDKNHSFFDADDDSEENIGEEIILVRDVFEDMGLHFQDYCHQKGVHAFRLGVCEDDKCLRMKVYLESFPKVCRVDAIYPFIAEQEFTYPLCEKLLEESYPRRFGALQYNASNKELSYRYSFPITHGMYKDDFQLVFLAVVKSAIESFDTVKQYAIGRFRNNIRQEIIDHAQNLLNELE